MTGFFKRVFHAVQQRALYALQLTIFSFSQNKEPLIIFLVPGFELRTGGILSIYSFYYETKEYFADKNCSVFMMSYPNGAKLWRYSWFENDVNIFAFDLLFHNKYKDRDILLNIPEYYVKDFIDSLTVTQQKKIYSFTSLRINIMNQNIEYMPSVDCVRSLKKYSSNITCTTAHDSYTTEFYRKYYDLPLHKLSSWFDREAIFVHPFEFKDDIMIVSQDAHPQKDDILARINQALPNIELVIVRNMKYEDYKRLEAKAKWSMTFGEGLDGYIVGPILRGGIGFGVFNDNFFTEEYRSMPNVSFSYDDFADHVIDFVRRNDNKYDYEYNHRVIYSLVTKQFNYQDYKNNIKLYYQGIYTLP